MNPTLAKIIMVLGAAAFGAVIGWITYFVLRRSRPQALSDLTTVIGALGGGAIIGLFNPRSLMFAGYALGLFVGFFAYFIFYLKFVGSGPLKLSMKKELEDTPGLGPLAQKKPSPKK